MRAQEFEDCPRTCQVMLTSSELLVSIHFLVYALPRGLYPWGAPEPPPATSWCVPLLLPVSAPHSPLPLQDPLILQTVLGAPLIGEGFLTSLLRGGESWPPLQGLARKGVRRTPSDLSHFSPSLYSSNT